MMGSQAPSESPDLALLSRVMPGIDFREPARWDFLALTESRDVQAAPGSGKTTLLVAKLCLLAEAWTEGRRGICVLSHTNVARAEVQTRLAGQPKGQALLGYPHFIGTSTAFIHQFLAMPHLRGMAAEVRVVDDDVFIADASRELEANRSINFWMKNKRLDPRSIAGRLLLDPLAMSLSQSGGLPGEGKVWEGLKAIRDELTRRGVFLYADMVAVAGLALRRRPELADRLSERFPFVFVDEAQDTPADHKALLQVAFPGSCVQWLGDCNQNIYDDGRGTWAPADSCLDLGGSKRFGHRTASFASRLTMMRSQEIVGEDGRDMLHSVILFDRSTIGQVLPTYGRVLAETASLPGNPEAWAVASKHRVPEKQPKAWPNCISDYWDGYRHPKPQGHRASTLLGTLHEAQRQAITLKSPQAALAGFGAALFRFLLRGGWAPGEGIHSQPRLWFALDDACPGARMKMRNFLKDALKAPLPATEEEWASYVRQVTAVAEALPGWAHRADDSFLAFDAMLPVVLGGDENIFPWEDGGRSVRIRLGTVASVKGQTHDATLVLETNEHTKMDVAEAVKAAFLTGERPTGTHVTKALINVFVGATRPRFGLCLATKREAVDAALEEAIHRSGWSVIDLTAARQRA